MIPMLPVYKYVMVIANNSFHKIFKLSQHYSSGLLLYEKNNTVKLSLFYGPYSHITGNKFKI